MAIVAQPEECRTRISAIIVMGVSASGKSTLGALLAERLACPFLEGDAFHSAANVEKMRNGIALTDADRGPWLRRLGAALRETVARHGLAVAACSALKDEYRQALAAAIGLTPIYILLDPPQAVLARRLAERHGHYMPASLLDSQLRTLERPVGDGGTLALVTEAAPAVQADQVIDWLRGCGLAGRAPASIDQGRAE